MGSATATSRYARLFLDADGANFGDTDYFAIEKFGDSGEVKLLQYSNANMSFWVNTSTQAMIIKNDGKVGIGTTSPARKLHVNGASDVARFQGSGSNYIDIDGNGTQLSCTTNLGFRAAVSGDTMMTIKTDGKVGIGTAAPGQALTVRCANTVAPRD